MGDAGPSMSDKPEEKTFLRLTKSGWIKLAVFLGLVGAIVVAFAAFRLDKKLDDILEWMDDNPVPGFFIFACLYVLAAVLFIPGLILSVGSGFVFGLPLGTLAVFVGATIGQTVAFLVGRYLLRDWISKKTETFSKWQAVEAAVSTEGWKIVGLLRLAPLVPYNALNYALGLTSVKFWQYFFASAIGILPGTLLYVYLGSVAADISEIANGEAVNGTVFIITAVVTGVVIVLVVILTTYYAKRAIKAKLNLSEDGEQNDTGAGGSQGANGENHNSWEKSEENQKKEKEEKHSSWENV
ncbi:hypothetical protein BSKO_09680 [Bryopsis sp. KO-2023]|nr:hypothetical protein BSKO_09680 [Bryopsis sp. KO-2023]